MSSRENFFPEAPASEVTLEHTVFQGLSPRQHRFSNTCETTQSSVRKTLWGSVPLLMTGTLALGAGGTPALPAYSPQTTEGARGTDTQADSRPALAERLSHAALPLAHTVLSSVRPDLPATYTVRSGDSVSSIADRFGIPTPAILTLNGLSWTSVVHEGQILKLSAEPTKKRAASVPRIAPEGYLVAPGETAGTIAARLGISTEALLTHNGLKPESIIFAGQTLRVPGTTVTTLERILPGDMPIVASAPRIIQASTTSLEATEDTTSPGETSETPAETVFDAADLPLAERPALVTVRVQQPQVAPKPPAPQPVTPAPVAKPSTPASAPAPAVTPTPAAQPASTVGQPVTGSITPLNDERRRNAQIIVDTGRELGVPDYGIVIALATAMQESSLRNISWGDRDSLGLYQQRPSTGWGTAEQIMDPVYSTRLFFGGPQNPNRGRTRGLLDIAGWQNMALTDAAQRVQISAYPLAYAKWEPSAWAWLYELT
jgi:N-acetylmuramoyl-L-alanine amidase